MKTQGKKKHFETLSQSFCISLNKLMNLFILDPLGTCYGWRTYNSYTMMSGDQRFFTGREILVTPSHSSGSQIRNSWCQYYSETKEERCTPQLLLWNGKGLPTNFIISVSDPVVVTGKWWICIRLRHIFWQGVTSSHATYQSKPQESSEDLSLLILKYIKQQINLKWSWSHLLLHQTSANMSFWRWTS